MEDFFVNNLGSIALALTAIVLIIVVSLVLFRKSKTDEKQSESILSLERRLTDLIIGQLKEMRTSQEGVSKAMNEQIGSFTKEATQIREDLKQVQDRVKDVSSFQEIFKSPKLRGEWGEASLDHVVSQHFPAELYKSQHTFASGDIVDLVLKLPNGQLLPIDSKFPSDSFSRMIDTTSPEERQTHQKRFVDDVKKMIDDISVKYIIPGEGTVDFALMYIPAEAVYYEIVNNIGKSFDLASYSWSKKVILASPNTIYLTLRTIEHWFRDTQISKQTQDILKRLSKVNQDATKLMGDFKKLGSHLKNAVSSYDNSEKRLDMFSDKVDKLLEVKETKKLK
ncbi:MAG: DNA recombination protein RmuC [Candidatus Nealsonbacteria bacterium]